MYWGNINNAVREVVKGREALRLLALYNNNNNLLTAIGLLPDGSSFVHVHNYEKGAKNLKPGGLHEKHAVATWSLGNHLSIRL